jgi:uncharacterized Fe-S cluster-containing MiaB family protein
MRTYGQIVDGKIITCNEFIKAVQKHLEMAIGKSVANDKVKKLYNKGYSIEDAVSFLILN